eukprot:5173496-Prymnesium_polylepis.1
MIAYWELHPSSAAATPRALWGGGPQRFATLVVTQPPCLVRMLNEPFTQTFTGSSWTEGKRCGYRTVGCVKTQTRASRRMRWTRSSSRGTPRTHSPQPVGGDRAWRGGAP